MPGKKFFVKNVANTMGAYNLEVSGKGGLPGSLILARHEISRPLTESEFQSKEVQRALKARELADVTRRQARR